MLFKVYSTRKVSSSNHREIHDRPFEIINHCPPRRVRLLHGESVATQHRKTHPLIQKFVIHTNGSPPGSTQLISDHREPRQRIRANIHVAQNYYGKTMFFLPSLEYYVKFRAEITQPSDRPKNIDLPLFKVYSTRGLSSSTQSRQKAVGSFTANRKSSFFYCLQACYERKSRFE